MNERPAPAEPATSNDITPGPFSEHELREAWNRQADEFNQWDSLEACEQLAWAQARAIAADRAGHSTPARLRHCPTHGHQPPEAWGCPECVRELREELKALRAVIAADRAGRPAPVEPGRVERLPDGKPYPTPPAEGDTAELAAALRRRAAQNPMGTADPTLTRAADLLQQQAAELATLRQVARPVAIPGVAYDDDMGDVTWWRFPVEEAPWVGTPGDSDWPGYHTHFTPCPPLPTAPEERTHG